jgi:uncharacterized membrane protein YidH (DUF202 family)
VEVEPGLSAQRTRMAWRRTATSAATVALLAVRPALTDGRGPTRTLVAAAAMAGWVALVAVAYQRGRALDARAPRPGRRALLAYAAITISYAMTGVLLVVT